MYRGAGHILKRPFVGKSDDGQDQIDRLEDRDGFYGFVEVLGEEVEEDLGPEEAFERGRDMV